MSEQFKPGDLAMVVRGTLCCGYGKLGFVFTVKRVDAGFLKCSNCGHVTAYKQRVWHSGNRASGTERLKKIDPPATGDSLPTRAEKEQKV